MKTLVIYSSKNESSLKKVEAWGKRHSGYTFLEVSDSKSIKEFKENNTTVRVVELDKAPTPKIEKPKKEVVKKVEKPVAEKPKAKKKVVAEKPTTKKKTKTSAVKKKTAKKKK